MQATLKLLDIARYKRKTLKKEKEKRKTRKSQTTTMNVFLLFFVRKHILKNLFYIVTFISQFFCVVVIGNRAIKHQCWNRYALVL